MGALAFEKQPTSEDVQDVLNQAIRKVKRDKEQKTACQRAAKTRSQPKRWPTPPKYIVCDKGGQFDCDSFRA
jgi:hypothetical protein